MAAFVQFMATWLLKRFESVVMEKRSLAGSSVSRRELSVVRMLAPSVRYAAKPRFMLVGLLSALAVSACAYVGESRMSSASETPVLYVLDYRPGPAWLRGRPLVEQNLEAHGAYMRDLAARGDILVAGPLSTVEGGLIVLRVPDLDAARAVMAADPAIRRGQFVGEVSAWRPMVDPSRRFSEPAG